MIAEARRRATEHGLELTFDVGEATALPYADGDFDVCRAARVLEHVPDPAGVLSDSDWDTLIVDHRTRNDANHRPHILRRDPERLDWPPAAASPRCAAL
jgi:hypothetical protein